MMVQVGVQVFVQVPSALENKEFKDLLAAIKEVGRYNLFNGEKLADWLLKNAKHFRFIRFGREYSPVIYITPYFHIRGHSKKELARQRKKAKAFVNRAERELKADEFWSVNSKTLEFRAWWD